MFDSFLQPSSPENSPVKQPAIRFKTSFKNCVLKALKNRNWKEAEGDSDWDIYWGEKETIQELLDRTHLNPNQRVNHFRNHFELTRKDHLMKNLKKYKRQLEKEGRIEEATTFDFFPMTYNLPSEYPIFCDEFKKNGNSVWIMKPIGKSQGKGIFLFNKLHQISNWKLEYKNKTDSVEDYVVQKYISNPLLIGGKKFDLRIYCLVTSYSPLTVYLYRDGFARFTHHRYTNHDLTNTYVHLTNVAIQKTSDHYDKKLGGKWNIRTLKQYMVSKYGAEIVDECFGKIQSLVLNTVQSVQKLMINDKHCFELYGFDVLLDDTLKPWLLEVNGSPSMTANTPEDSKLKCTLLNDVFTILDLEKDLTGQEEQIGGFDLIYRGNPIKPSSSLIVNSTMLGCLSNRSALLGLLAKEMAGKVSHIKKQKTEISVKANNSTKQAASSNREKHKETEHSHHHSHTYRIRIMDNIPAILKSTPPKKRNSLGSTGNIFTFSKTNISTSEANLSSTLHTQTNHVPTISHQTSAPTSQLRGVIEDIKASSRRKTRKIKVNEISHSQTNMLHSSGFHKPESLMIVSKSTATVPKLSSTVSNRAPFRPIGPSNIELVVPDLKKLQEEEGRKTVGARPKQVRPSTTMSSSENNRESFGCRTLAKDFDIFRVPGKVNGKTLVDSIQISKMKCEANTDEDQYEENDENDPRVLSLKNIEDIKRPVKTCRIKLWSGKIKVSRKEEKGDETSRDESSSQEKENMTLQTVRTEIIADQA